MSIGYDRENLPPCFSGFEGINRYWDNVHQRFAAKILPGEYYVTAQDEIITTVLGSCVSACIRDRQSGVGGMNHFMLPTRNALHDQWDNSDVVGLAARYGNFAMEHLINEIIKNGGKRRNLEVKVFGGGAVLNNMTDIGKKNIEFVMHYLYDENLAIVSQDVGDSFPRKVVYHPLSGKVKIKKLRNQHNTTIAQRERKYMHDLNTQPQEGDIELF